MKDYLELSAWILFTTGSVIFFVDNVRLGNTLGSIGSAIFVIACLLFIISRDKK